MNSASKYNENDATQGYQHTTDRWKSSTHLGVEAIQFIGAPIGQGDETDRLQFSCWRPCGRSWSWGWWCNDVRQDHDLRLADIEQRHDNGNGCRQKGLCIISEIGVDNGNVIAQAVLCTHGTRGEHTGTRQQMHFRVPRTVHHIPDSSFRRQEHREATRSHIHRFRT